MKMKKNEMSRLGTVLYSILGALQVHHKGWSWSTVEWNPNLDAEAMERGLNPDHLFCRCCLNVRGGLQRPSSQTCLQSRPAHPSKLIGQRKHVTVCFAFTALTNRCANLTPDTGYHFHLKSRTPPPSGCLCSANASGDHPAVNA